MTRICFVGSTRYTRPLDATQGKKWCALARLRQVWVIGFSTSWRPRRFVEHAGFYLLPAPPLALVRHGLMATAGTMLTCWIVLAHGVRVLVAQSPYEGVSAALVKSAARLLGQRVALVVESHGDFEESVFLYRRVVLPRVRRRVMRWAAWWVLRRADVLRAVSGSTEGQLARWAPGVPIFRFPTWTDIEVFFEAGRHRSGEVRPDIVYVGVLTPLKGVHLLIEAFTVIVARMPEARLLLVGKPENPDYAEELRAQVVRCQLDGQVQFVAAVPQEQVAGYMARAGVVVLPTLSEGLPRVVLEAMAAGRPVVATAVGGIPEVVEDGVTGLLVPPGDVKGLSERLLRILSSPEEAEAMGGRARERVRAVFSPSAYVANYARVFERAEATLAEPGERGLG